MQNQETKNYYDSPPPSYDSIDNSSALSAPNQQLQNEEMPFCPSPPPPYDNSELSTLSFSISSTDSSSTYESCQTCEFSEAHHFHYEESNGLTWTSRILIFFSLLMFSVGAGLFLAAIIKIMFPK